MLRLSGVFKSKELWSVGYGSMGCDDYDEWSFGGPDNDWSVWVPYIYWRSLVSTLDIP